MKNWLINEESGQGMVEYGLLLALIAVALIGIWKAVGGKVKNVATSVSNGLDEAQSSADNHA